MDLADRNYHKRLLEMCDCYMDTDHLTAIKAMVNSSTEDIEEEGLKYLALAILHAVSEKASKLTIKRKKENITASLTAGDKNAIPTPTPEVIEKVFEMMRQIMHLEEDKGRMNLSIGLGNDKIDIDVKLELGKDKEALKVKFPDL